MNRRFMIASVFVLAGLVAALFQLKHQVGQLEKDLRRNLVEIQNEHNSLRVLRAEWSYLTSPSRLQTLAIRHISLRPLTTQQIGRIEQIPFFEDHLLDIKSTKNQTNIKRLQDGR